MNDAEQIFRETELERKRAGYGAKHRPRGGGAVRLPSDTLSKKEREALNGEMVVFQEKPFYSYEEFKALPDDLKLKWVNSLNNLYGVGLTTISEVCFGDVRRCKRVLEAAGLLEYINGSGKRGSAGAKDKARLQAAFDQYRGSEEKTVEKPQETLQEKPPADYYDLIYHLGRIDGLLATLPESMRAAESLRRIREFIMEERHGKIDV